MTKVLVVQNTRNEGSGFFGKLLSYDGFDITSIHAKQEKLPSDDFDFLVVLGAPESANDDLPYLKAEQELIKKFVEHKKPVLGICLGSQLIAKAFGGKVYRGPKKEIGFYHDLVVCDSSSRLFLGFENPFTVFHWHGDTFDLPLGAIRLVKSNDYPNQAFQFKTAVGLQFHLEVDQSMINLWLDKTQEKLEKIPYIDPKKIRVDINENISYVNSNLEKFYQNFKSTFNL
jgi:GMP synthase-like glutamine amidotransferase